MKLINNRYRVVRTSNKVEAEDSYIVKDLQENEEIKLLTIYNASRDNKIIDYLTKEFKSLSNVKHKSLINLEKFDIVESINLKKANNQMYYVLNENINSPRLIDIKDNMSLENILNIILDLMCVIDYLHYRGYTYKHLSPANIFVDDDYSIKIKDLASVYRDFIYSNHDYTTELFIAPEIFSNNEKISKYVDFYSIGTIMEYLLFKGLNTEEISKDDFKDELDLTEHQKVFLLNIIKNLTHKDVIFRNISLEKHIKNIILAFDLNYDYDLVKERDNLILNTAIVGRDKEINSLLRIDNLIIKGNKIFNGAIISARTGSGKTKLLDEMAFRFSLLNRSVLYLRVGEDIITGGININTLLKSSFKYASNELINKYNDDFNELLKYNNGQIRYEELNSKTAPEKYRIYNKLTNYFDDLSKNKPVYILIDDIHFSNDDFINFIKYMMLKLENNRIFFIVTSVEPALIHEKTMVKNIQAMINEDSIIHIELNNLSETDTGKLIQKILGMNYIAKRFTSYIYKESLGNPKYIYYIIKDLYNREELYMSEKGIWQTKENDYNKIIISIDENHVINSQLENIDEDKYRVLEIISLSKDMIPKGILRDMLKIDELDIDHIIKCLLECRMIDDKIIDNAETLSIYSAELKRIVSSRISDTDRIKLHKRLANSIIKLYEDGYQFIMEELIYHLANSDQKDYALEIVLLELQRQPNRYSSYSISLYEHAYNLVKDTENDEILEILNSLIKIYDMKGHLELIDGYITKMQSIALEKGDLEYLIKAKYHKIRLHLKANQLDAAWELILEIDYILDKNKNLWDGQILLLMSKVNLSFSKNQFDDVENYLKEAVKISKESNILQYLGNIYNLYGVYYYLNGISDKSIDYFNKSIEAYEQDNNIIEESKPINNLGNIYYNIYGMYDKALEYYKNGYEIATKYENANASAIFTTNIGEIYYGNLQLDEALKYFERSRNISNEIGDYKGTIISNLNLGLIYLRTNKCGKADEIYNFIEEINKEEPLLDSEILTAYYTFMGRYYRHYGKLEEAMVYYGFLSEMAKEYNNPDYLLAESSILIIKGLYYSDYNRDKLEKIINDFQINKMNNLDLEILLLFALIAAKFEDIDFANQILDIYSKNSNETNKSLKALRDTIDTIIDPSVNKLLSLESYLDRKLYAENKLNIYTVLAREWAKFKNYNRAINNTFKALDNIFRRAELIKDKDLQYSFIKRRNADQLKKNLSKYIERNFNKKIEYISLDEAYEKNIRYNDLIHILNQLDPIEYGEIRNIDIKYEKMDSTEALLSEFSDDHQSNLDSILDYLGYKTLANRGFILTHNSEDGTYKIVSSLIEDDSDIPRGNILSQSDRSSVGILINKNLKNMEDSKYIELLPDEAVSIMCVPLNNKKKNIIKVDRRKKNAPFSLNNSLLDRKSKIYIYLESDSYLNKFEYDKLISIKQLTSLILLNIENKYLKNVTVVDKLTGVLTRKYFDLQIDNVIEEYNKYNGSFSLLMIDIDNFKALNDTCGHLIGDDALAMLGSKLLESVRSTDLVARYGGDEFIIALFDTTMEEGLKIAEKIRKNVLEIKDFNVKREISVSIGLAQYPDHGQAKKELIQKADQALYMAKEQYGKNISVAWTIDMEEGTKNLNKLAGILTGNINKDNVNISAVINVAELIENKISKSEKIAEFTNIILGVVEAEYSTFIEFQNGDRYDAPLYKTKIRNLAEWVKTPRLNMDIIQRVVENKKGEFLIDWDDSTAQDPFTEEPIWQSLLVLPLIKNGIVLGLIYLSVPLKEKEFNIEDFNLGNLLSNIFTAVLDTE